MEPVEVKIRLLFEGRLSHGQSCHISYFYIKFRALSWNLYVVKNIIINVLTVLESRFEIKFAKTPSWINGWGKPKTLVGVWEETTEQSDEQQKFTDFQQSQRGLPIFIYIYLVPKGNTRMLLVSSIHKSLG